MFWAGKCRKQVVCTRCSTKLGIFYLQFFLQPTVGYFQAAVRLYVHNQFWRCNTNDIICTLKKAEMIRDFHVSLGKTAKKMSHAVTRMLWIMMKYGVYYYYICINLFIINLHCCLHFHAFLNFYNNPMLVSLWTKHALLGGLVDKYLVLGDLVVQCPNPWCYRDLATMVYMASNGIHLGKPSPIPKIKGLQC